MDGQSNNLRVKRKNKEWKGYKSQKHFKVYHYHKEMYIKEPSVTLPENSEASFTLKTNVK